MIAKIICRLGIAKNLFTSVWSIRAKSKSKKILLRFTRCNYI